MIGHLVRGGALVGVCGLVAVVGMRLAAPAPPMTTDHALELPAPPPEGYEVVAARALDRFETFRSGYGAPEMALDGPELTALLSTSLPGFVPDAVLHPVVDIRGSVVRVRARVVTADWAGSDPLRSVLPLLPDTVLAELEGAVVQRGRRAVFLVETARAQGLVIPTGLVAGLLRDLPGAPAAGTDRAEPGQPMLSVRLPAGVTAVRTRGDRLVLRTEPIFDRAVDGDMEP